MHARPSADNVDRLLAAIVAFEFPAVDLPRRQLFERSLITMSIEVGARIGVYEIASEIGRGGMGEVYRARDTRLNRDVALKILPAAFASDPERLARFEREAQVLASLNHPNIAQIYGIEEGPADAGHDVRALVMELVDGETLADRIARGPIPIDETLPIARQIAEALEAAHEQGIIHRDLKPANIKVRPDGAVKVLDFGLAKLAQPAGIAPGSRATASLSPTITSPALMTGVGVLLGTAAYMSPEQARGREADKRSDIWAFGCVLYEMVAGQRAFDGEDVADTLARIIHAEPNWELVPAQCRLLVRSCLEKSIRKRLRDLGDAWRLLEIEHFAPPVASRTQLAGWIAAAVLVFGLVGILVMRGREPSVPDALPLHLSIALPGVDDDVRSIALSPDGRSLAAAASIGDRYQLWVRDLEQAEFRPLGGTALARVPFWSADGRSIGFFADQKLKTVAAAGGPPQVLCEAGLGYGGTWNRAGVILFAPLGTGAIFRADAARGECVPLTKPEPGTAHVFPEFLEDGRHFFYVVVRGEQTKRGVYLASLDQPNGRRMLADESSVAYLPSADHQGLGLLLFLRDETLMAQRFDAARLELVGAAAPVVKGVSRSNTAPQMAVAASARGALVYVTNAWTARDLQLAWVNRAGHELGSIGAPGDFAGVSLSPDERFAAVVIRESNGTTSDLWMHDLTRGGITRLTASAGGSVIAPVWAADGKQMIFGGLRPGNAARDLYHTVLGRGGEEPLYRSGVEKSPSDWSRDGRTLIFTETTSATGADVWVLPHGTSSSEPAKPWPFARTRFNETHGRLSPDGHWLAYTSNASGENEIYIKPFPKGDGEWLVSTTSGREPQWRSDGKELYYIEGHLNRVRLVAVPITLTPTPVIGMPTGLFEFRTNTGVESLNWFTYAATAGGQRFLITRYAEGAQPRLDVKLNWSQVLGNNTTR